MDFNFDALKMSRMNHFKAGPKIRDPLGGLCWVYFDSKFRFLSILMLWTGCEGPPGPQVASKPVGP